MNNFDVMRMLTQFSNRQLMFNKNISQTKQSLEQPAFEETFSPQIVEKQVTETKTLQMNTLQSMDRAVYAKEVMQFPKNLNEFVYMLQKGLNQAQFNQLFANQIAMQRNALSQTQAQILAQLQGLTSPNQIQTLIQSQMAIQLKTSIKNLEISENGMINLSQISQLIQANGKEALTKIITSMSHASKEGINDLSQMKEMAKLINASIAAASQNNPAQTLKLLMLLYLPWLPLEEGVGFDLEIETQKTETESDSILTITISTVNYGTVTATLVLETSNSVHVSIECTNEFPKEDLLLRIQGEQQHYSMNSVISFSECNTTSTDKKAKAKVNMSQTTEINPFMLLMAHSVIRHTIEIDNNTSIGVKTHIDD